MNDTATAVFAHARNICRGEARLIFIPFPVEGWAIPGGGIVTNEYEAIQICLEMNRLIKENTPTTPKADVVAWGWK